MCFDVRNNFIWMCSNDWVDQFFNPGHQPLHHIHRRLKVTDQVILPPGYFLFKIIYSVLQMYYIYYYKALKMISFVYLQFFRETPCHPVH